MESMSVFLFYSRCTHGRKHVDFDLVAQEERRVRLPCWFASMHGHGVLMHRSIDRGLMLHQANVRIERSILSCLLRRALYEIRDTNERTTISNETNLWFVRCCQRSSSVSARWLCLGSDKLMKYYGTSLRSACTTVGV
jgi:hypothetical protein